MSHISAGLEAQEHLQELYKHLMALEASYRTQKIVHFRPNPASPGQKKFFQDSTASIRLAIGDNRGGKSVCGVVEAVAHSLGYRPWLDPDHPDRIVRLPNGKPIPVPNVGRVIAQDFPQAIKQNIWEKIREWAPAGFYTIRTSNQGIPIEVKWKNGSVWYLMADSQDDLSFEGTRGHWFWVDEPIGYKKFVALRRGLVDFNGHCWMTLTPLTQPWIADIIAERANDPDGEVKMYRFRIEENRTEVGGYLSDEAIKSFVDDLRDDERAMRIGGEWGHLTGRVFKEWKPEAPYWIEPFKVPQTWPRVCIIDPHPRKPVAVTWFAITPDNQKYIYRELFDENLRTIADVSAKIKELEKDEIIGMRLIDPASHQNERTSGKSVRQMFAECGIWTLPAAKYNIEAGIDSIHEALKLRNDWSEPGLIVFNTCPNVKKNFMRFVWDDWKTSKDRDIKGERQEVRKSDDDFIACIRYLFQSGMTYTQLKRESARQEASDPLDDFRGLNMHTGDYIGRYDGSRTESSAFAYPE